ncbi:hypothetical protein RHGRI_006230 [Rhododendron griersonianum]|uniref:Uncharacterized protein n=1 Tax=Rhododendron griersonianum TaxID=479676 RepID=A0AAV6KSR8_9ERIC|nr:hypothetical protein RHGRI_006230 [Rhododendron griersonianum]
MRIQPTRKRNPPPPLSSPPPPYSDSPPLHHLHSPQSHLLQPTDSPNQTPAKDRQPSDPTVVAVSGTDGVDFSSDEMNNGTRCKRSGSNQDSSLSHGEEEVDAEDNLTVVTNPRLGYSYDAETSAGGSPCPSPSHEGHWCEEDKLFPLKKRRASFTSKVRARMAADREQKESVREPTRNTEKTWVKHYDDPENEEEQEKNEANKKQSGEGGGKIQVANSRCSRNSGRGWRCNRPAILGSPAAFYRAVDKLPGPSLTKVKLDG